MHLSVITLFPDMVRRVMQESIMGRAWEQKLFSLDLIQIRDHALNDYGKIDDYCYGGGTGMLLMAEPVFLAWQQAVTLRYGKAPQAHQVADWKKEEGRQSLTIFLSPKGEVFRQQVASDLSCLEHIILICGHYEGIDQRVLDLVVDRTLSIGDYVLSGGELAACVVMDALLRLVPGVLPTEAYQEESHMSRRLEHPQYTRPATWQGKDVPDVLLSGHQANIKRWKRGQSLWETACYRPDLLQDDPILPQDWQEMLAVRRESDKTSLAARRKPK